MLRVADPVAAARAVHQDTGGQRAQLQAVQVEPAGGLGEVGVQQLAAVVQPEAVELTGGHPAADPLRRFQDLDGEAAAGQRAGGGQARESGAHHDDVRVGLTAGAAGEVICGHGRAPSLVPGCD